MPHAESLLIENSHHIPCTEGMRIGGANVCHIGLLGSSLVQREEFEKSGREDGTSGSSSFQTTTPAYPN